MTDPHFVANGAQPAVDAHLVVAGGPGSPAASETAAGRAESDFRAFFGVFDSGGKGFWSADDLARVCKLLWEQDGSKPPPYAFRQEALRHMKQTARSAGAAEDAREAADGLTLEEVRLSWLPFKARRHRVFRQWAMARCRSVFACPYCQGHFRLRVGEAGQEVAAVSSTGTPLFHLSCPSSAAALLPRSSAVNDLHDKVARGVAGGARTVALPPGCVSWTPSLSSWLRQSRRFALSSRSSPHKSRSSLCCGFARTVGGRSP